MQSQIWCNWIGADAVFHSPEVLGSRGGSCVGPCGCLETPPGQGPQCCSGPAGRDLSPVSGRVTCFLNQSSLGSCRIGLEQALCSTHQRSYDPVGSPVWALAGVGQDSAGEVARGSSLESSGRDLCPRSGPGSLLPYVLQSQVPRDWIGAGTVFHSPEVLGSRGESCVRPCGC